MGMNPGTFLKRTEGIITGFGFKKSIPLSLYSFHLTSDGSQLTVILDTNAGYDKKGTSNTKHTVLTWAAGKTVAAGIQVRVPDDYDKDNDIFILKLKAVMGSTTGPDTPNFGAAAYKNEASTDLAPSDTDDLSDTIAWVDIDLSGNGLVAGDNLTIDLTPETHGSDAIDIFAAKIEYRSDLVFNDPDRR